MPQTTILLFRRADRTVPLLEWLNNLETRDRGVHSKCLERILALEGFGSELRRPRADFLRDGIFELRARAGNTQWRILYFFSGQNEAVLSHGFQKRSQRVDDIEIGRAMGNRELVLQDKRKHTAEWIEDEDEGDEDG